MRKILLKKIILVILSICGFTCRENQIAFDHLYTIDIQDIEKKNDAEFLSSVISHLEYIPLETNEDCLLNDIQRVIFMNNYIIAYDLYNILVFDNNGHFIRRIGQTGNGPGDFHLVTYILCDPLEETIYQFQSHQINKYAIEGEFIKSIIIEGGYQSAIIDHDNSILLYRFNIPLFEGDTTTLYSIDRIDSEGRVTKRYLNPAHRYIKKYPFIGGNIHPFIRSGKNIRFHEYSGDTLYTINQNALEPYAIFNYGKYKTDTTPDFSATSTHSEREAVISLYNKKLILRHLDETNNYFYMTFGWGFTQQKLYVLYNKQTRELRNLGTEGFVNDINGMSPFFSRFINEDGYMVNWIDAEELKEEVLSKNYDTFKNQYGDAFIHLHKLVSQLPDDNNPVIIIGK